MERLRYLNSVLTFFLVFNTDLDGEDLDPVELQDFPLLRDCLQNVDPDVGFDIEIKYPLDLKVSLPIKFNLPSAKPICSLFSFLCLVST